jgi:hypothetical protein
MRSPLRVLGAARRRVIDIYVESPLVAETRIKDAYEESERGVHDTRDRAHAEMEELCLGRLHTRVELSGVLTHTFDRVKDVSLRRKEGF